MSRHTITAPLTIHHCDVEASVSFDCSPDELTELEITEVLVHGCDVLSELGDAEYECLWERCVEHMADLIESAAAAEQDHWDNVRKETE